MKPHSADELAREGAVRPSSRRPGAARAVATLFGIGTRRCRLAAAFVVVMVGLVGHTANQAFAQAEGAVLYLDASAVSTDRATRAGETARAHHSDPRSSASPDALAWLGVRGPRGDDTEAPPQDAAGAFASVTAPDAEGTPGITAQAAYAAGETMLAQVEDVAPAEDGGSDEDELAVVGAVRPELGDGTRASEEQPSADYEAPPAEQPTTSDLASSPEPVVPVAEPSGDEGLALEAPTQTAPAQKELAAAPSEDASPAPEISLDTEPDYGATGPISEPVSTPEPSAEPETQEEEIQEPELQKPKTQDEEIREPEDDGGELAGADAVPAATPDTGPTSGESGDVALAPTSSPPPKDAGPDDPASASPAPEESAPEESAPELAVPEDGSETEVSEEQISEVVVVQKSDAGGGAQPPASRPPDFTLPGDKAQDDPAMDTGPPPWTSPSEETEPKAAPPAEEPPAEEPPAGKPTDDGADEEEVPLSGGPEEQPSDQTGTGSEETTSPLHGEYTREPAPDTPHGDGPNDEGTAGNPSGCGYLLHAPENADCDGVPDTLPSEEAPPSDEAHPSAQAPAEDGGQGGGRNIPRGPNSGGDAGEDRPLPDGGPHGPPETTDESLAPSEDRAPDPASGDGGITDPRPGDEAPGGGTDRGAESPREDHRGNGGDRGQSFAVSPDERLRRAEEGDGGAGAADPGGAEEPAPASASAEPYPEERTAGESARSRPDTGPVASQSAVDEVTASPETRPAGGKVRAQRTPPIWDRRDVPPGRPQSSEVPATDRRAAAERAEERRESRQAEHFAARVAERKAERRANRTVARRAAGEQAAVEQAAVERAAVREERRQKRPAAGGAFDVRGAASSTGRRRNAPAHQDPVPQSAAVESDPVRQVTARRFVPVEQPAAVDLPPARQEPAAQVRAESQIRRPFGSGGAAGQASGVARVSKSVNRSVGR